MLGRYALYDRIASGGMASIHIGRLLGPVGFARTVAIKRMHPQLAEDPEFVTMFLDEARLAARIRHPNVVPTLDVVALPGELFLVMEFVQGESLSRLLRTASARGERIPAEMIAAIMVGTLHGLHAAHEAKSDHGEPLGIVHRDVSPHNILVGTDGVARVLDFGVAKAVGRLHTTREGKLKGKLAYMAPEQVRGDVSRRTDVYAAAVVLWEALAGKRLFPGENEAQVLDRVLRGCDVPPSEHALGLQRSLDAVTMRGLRVDPAERFPTARDMARALEDAIPLATASRIGDWVEATARETLEERSARIAGIESDSTAQAKRPRARVPSLTSEELLASVGTPSSQPAGATSDVAGEEVLFTQLSSGLGSSGSKSLPAPNRRRPWLVATGVTLVAATAIVAVLARRSATPSPAASAPLPAPSLTEVAPPAASASAPRVHLEAVPSAAASVSVAAPVASAMPSPTASVRHAAPRATPCKLVRVLDSNGEPHFSCPCARCS
jgi:serine/threonine-protein kinase